VVIENRIGANGNIAAEQVSKSAARRLHRLRLRQRDLGDQSALYAKVPYRPLADFAASAPSRPSRLSYDPSVGPRTTYAEFIAYAKKNPGKLSYASAGNGSIHHITTELFKSLAGIEMVHVPYKGMGQGGPALIAGDVQVRVLQLLPRWRSSQSGKGTHPRQRRRQAHARAAGHPDHRRARIPGFDMASMLGMLVPVGVAAGHRREAERRCRRRRCVARGHEKIAGFGVRHRHRHARAIRRADARGVRRSTRGW